MNKLVTPLLLILLGYNSIGYYIFYSVQKSRAEIEITEYINRGEYLEEELTLFKIPIQEYTFLTGKDFNRVEGDLEYKGKFYERVKENLVNDTMYIYCINDEKQELLYQQLADHVQNNIIDGKSNTKSKSAKIFKDLLKDYLPKSSTLIADNHHLVVERKYRAFSKANFQSISKKITSPPPQIGLIS